MLALLEATVASNATDQKAAAERASADLRKALAIATNLAAVVEPSLTRARALTATDSK